MPGPLPNPRHERFARLTLRLDNLSEAYTRAGYHTKAGQSTWTGASRLMRHDQVKRRIAELRRFAAHNGRVSVERLLSQCEEDRALARSLRQPAAAIAATALMGRLCGLLIDRKESGAPGQFAALADVPDVIAQVRQSYGERAAELFEQLIAEAGKEQREYGLPPTSDASR